MEINTLSDYELLNIVMGKDTQNESIKEALASYSCMPKFIFDYSEDELLKIKGIGKSTINKIEALKQILVRINSYKTKEVITISSHNDFYNVVRLDMIHMDQEVLRVTCLNTKNHIIHTEDVFKGSLNSSIVHPREIFKLALKHNAAAIIIAHNHPSGDPTPSKEDINITLRLKECSKIMGIELLDHLIIGNNHFVSLKEKGII